MSNGASCGDASSILAKSTKIYARKKFFIIAVALPILIISTTLIYFLNLPKNNQPPQGPCPSLSSQNQNAPGPNAPKKPCTRQFAQKNNEALKNFLEEEEGLRLEDNFIELGEPQISQKIKAISEYRSQIAAFKSMGTYTLALSKKFTSERCKTTNPQWSGCEAVYHIVPRQMLRRIEG